MEIAIGVAIALGIVLLLAVLGVIGFAGYKYWAILRSLRDQMRIMNGSLNGVPVILDGIKAICVELSSNTLRMSSSAEALKKSLLADETSDARRGPGVMQYDDEAADRAYMQQVMQQNEALAGEEGGRFIVRD